jgi:hypothetical protein
MNNRNEVIIQTLYRHLKGYELTRQEWELFQNWLTESEANREMFKNLSDPEWLAAARLRYYAPGKEKGLQQLREALITGRPIEKTEGRLFRWLAILICCAFALFALVFAFYSK